MEPRKVELDYQAQIGEFVSTLFKTMLECDVTPDPAGCPHGELITALIAFSGKWRGSFSLECDRASALLLARRFLQMEEIEERSEEVRDAIGELANVLAGNLKKILPNGTALAAPSLVEGTDYTIRMCGETLIGRTAFKSDIGSLVVRLFEDSKGNEGVA